MGYTFIKKEWAQYPTLAAVRHVNDDVGDHANHAFLWDQIEVGSDVHVVVHEIVFDAITWGTTQQPQYTNRT